VGPTELERLDEAAALARSSAFRKLRTWPWRLGVSKLQELYCRALGRTIPVVARTFWGDPMNLVVPDGVSLTIMRYGFFEAELSKIVVGRLRPGMVFFDVGAHFGYFSLLASALVQPGGQVHAFEPTPSTYAVLRSNLAGRPAAHAVNAAAHRAESILDLKDFGMRHAGFNTLYEGKLADHERRRARHRIVKVRALALDDYVAETGVAPDFVKIDTEGAEPDVIAGFERTLRARRPTLSIEVGDKDLPGALPSRDVVAMILALGYEALQCERGALVPHRPKARYDYDNLLFVPA
jgi:FkbM family methyltransferase